MNTLKIEAELAYKYRYKPLSKDLSEKYRNFFTDNIPYFLSVYGSGSSLYTNHGTLICTGYDRVVVGDYGAFVEFSENHASPHIVIKKGQEYRINNDRYRNNVKYIWLTINDNSDVKIYFQKRTVSYADYVPNKYYVSVHEVFV